MHYKLTLIALIFPLVLFSQVAEKEVQQRTLTLEEAITIAKDSSLNSFVAKNLYLSGYWQYRSYKAERLPSINLDMTPLSYNHNFVKRYDSGSNMDVYKSQQALYSYANLSIKQNLDITGGSFYLDTELGYLRNFGVNGYQQYSTVPFRIGYEQSLFGFNSFKWQKKLEPIRYEKAMKQLVFDLEQISEQTSNYFFDLQLNQKIYDLATKNVANCDTLYQIGLERYKIGSLSQSDVLTLKLEALNSKNDVGNAQLALKKATTNLASFLRLNRNSQFQLELPKEALNIMIPVEEVMNKAKENNPTFPSMREIILTAQQNYERTVRESRFSASVSASVGFNQAEANLSDAYTKPKQRDVVAVSLNVPLLDWGVRKGRVNVVRQQLNTATLSAQQTQQAFEEDVYTTVYEFNLRQHQIQATKEAKDIAEQAFQKSKELFFVGKTDANSINLSIIRQIEAERNYISALKYYWLSYYKIRKLTLYDFIAKKPISVDFKNLEGM